MSRMTSRIIVGEWHRACAGYAGGRWPHQIQPTRRSRLPTVRTPSQIEFYEPVIETDGVDVMEKSYQPSQVWSPDFSKKKPVSATEIGSAIHELMQRLPLVPKGCKLNIEASTIDYQSVMSEGSHSNGENFGFLWRNPSGASYQKADKVLRGPVAAAQKEDPESKGKFVVRGIIDGILLDDRIVLLITRLINSLIQKISAFASQMSLYAEASKVVYSIPECGKTPYFIGRWKLKNHHLVNDMKTKNKRYESACLVLYKV